jgi:hypothetical protein
MFAPLRDGPCESNELEGRGRAPLASQPDSCCIWSASTRLPDGAVDAVCVDSEDCLQTGVNDFPNADEGDVEAALPSAIFT